MFTISGVFTSTSLTTLIINFLGTPSPYPLLFGITYPTYWPTPEPNIDLLSVNTPASEVSVKVVLFNLNVTLSAFSES